MHSPADDPTTKRQLGPPRPDPDRERDDPRLAAAVGRLRHWGRARPPLLTVAARLPHATQLDPDEPGLVWEARAVPGIAVASRARVSLMRVASRTDRGSTLVGQVQATGPLDHPLDRAELAWYAHEPDRGATRELDEPDAWFTAVLGAHHRAGGAPLDLTPGPVLERLR